MKDKPQIMKEAAKLFIEIFQEEPWREKFKLTQVMKIMKEQFNKSKDVALAVLKDNKVIGFAWMYEILESDLEKNTRYSPELNFLFKKQKRVFYFQEIGVKKELRKQGIGVKLIREVLRIGKEKGANIVVLSTNTRAQSAVLMFSKIGFQNSGIIRPPKELGRTYWILEL